MKKSLRKFLEISSGYYRLFGVKKDKPLAWVSSFAPVEILDAFDIDYIYPESYAAVISASNKETACIDRAGQMNIDKSTCSYATTFNGSYFKGEGPRGIPGVPDVIVAANNQCSTLPGWWSYLAEELNVPCFIVDYPGELNFSGCTGAYIMSRHERLIEFLQENTPAVFNEQRLVQAVENSRESVKMWKKILELRREYYIPCQVTFDYIFPLVVRRSSPLTSDFYQYLCQDLLASIRKLGDEKRIIWMGYPLWYERKRCLEFVETANIKIVSDNYSGWWNLDFSGKNWQEQLVNAYNFTVLNRSIEYRIVELLDKIETFHIHGVIFNLNRSCKRDAALNRVLKERISIPAVLIETDMVDRRYCQKAAVDLRLQTFKELVLNVVRN